MKEQSKFFIDAGTTWSKILEIKPNGEEAFKVLPTIEAKNLNINFEKITGHTTDKTAKNYENEVVALALGAKDVLEKKYKNFKSETSTVLDLGSRDVKWVRYKNGEFSDMDWNSSCASATGATIEMLLKFYDVNVKDLEFQEEKYPVTCGIFGLEKIMDDVSKGIKPSVAISKFVHGIAYNAWNFTENPEKLYVSGGFCKNECFIKSLEKYCKVVPLGRFVLVLGLKSQPVRDLKNGIQNV